MKWIFENDRPIYIQVVEQIKMFIISGRYKPGEKLPSVRELAAEAKINPNTMQKAMAELETAKLVFSNRTNGRYITNDEDLIKNIKDEYALEIISEMCAKLMTVGYSKTGIIGMINEYENGGSDNE